MADIADIKDRKPNQELIKLLEKYLLEAKSGDLRTLICVAGYSDDKWSNWWALDVRNGTRKMLGEISMLHFDMLTNIALKDGDTFIARALDK
jgi:hypothetical protein